MPDRKRGYTNETDVAYRRTDTGDFIHEESIQTTEESKQRSGQERVRSMRLEV